MDAARLADARNDRAQALALMRAFAQRTGLEGDAPPRRYLWTDAFAVCNFLALDEHAAAARLVAQVHDVLGAHRPDDPRQGPLSGLVGEAARRHPTQGGLRIGKPLPERAPDAPYEPALEWERDGQYFHYLTRWMHALDQYARHAGAPDANRWARELARTAVRAFVSAGDDGAPRMAWKMGIALDRPLVAGMGQHDPLDGLVTCLQLRAHTPPASGGPTLAPELRTLAALLSGTSLRSDDPLAIGGLLADAYRLAQLLDERPGDDALLGLLLAAAAAGLAGWLCDHPLARPPAQRLAFRELGLAIGLLAAARLWRLLEHAPVAAPVRHSLDQVIAQVPLARRISRHWLAVALDPSPEWCAHEDINAVMLATCLVPEGWLDFADGTAAPPRAASVQPG
ncbi:MAG TPA: hypothetical protein VM576_01425 [Xanthomonadaceae bacterium]|nr:hypothetical protein [Xanthomonadaceae bacterium]